MRFVCLVSNPFPWPIYLISCIPHHDHISMPRIPLMHSALLNTSNTCGHKTCKCVTNPCLCMGDSMKAGNTFWPNLVMKTLFFTHVLDRSPQNVYMPCEFRFSVKKQIVEYYVGFPMIFF